MKKLVLTLAAFFTLGISTYAQADETRDKLKEEMSISLAEQFVAAGLDEETAGTMAECTVDKLIDGLSDEELEEMVAAGDNFQPDEEMLVKLQQYMGECMGQ